VFSRWGQELFFTNNKEQGWDGTFHGMKQDIGVYNYLIIVAKPGGDNVVYKGNVTLIR
jgi:gliding motility-associated-like protein